MCESAYQSTSPNRSSRSHDALLRDVCGYTLIMLLVVIAIAGLGLSAVSAVWTTTAKREKEQQLLWVGLQFRDAIASYSKSSPGAAQYPKRLEDLLQDPRFPNVKRHLRQIYRDPFSGEAEWGLVKNGDFIIGVYSLAKGAPIKKSGFARGLESFEEASRYGDWKFVYSGGAEAGTRGAVPAAPSLAAANPPQMAIPVPVAPPEPQRSPAEEQRRQRQCETQQKSENQMCNLYALPSGREALLECQRSVDRRHEYCVSDPHDGSSQPGLDLPSQ